MAQIQSSKFEQTPLVDVQQWSDVEKDKHHSIFDRWETLDFFSNFPSIVVFENFPSEWDSGSSDQPKRNASVLQKYSLREFTNFDLTLISQFDSESENGRGDRLCLRLMYNLNRYTQHSATQVLMR